MVESSYMLRGIDRCQATLPSHYIGVLRGCDAVHKAGYSAPTRASHRADADIHSGDEQLHIGVSARASAIQARAIQTRAIRAGQEHKERQELPDSQPWSVRVKGDSPAQNAI